MTRDRRRWLPVVWCLILVGATLILLQLRGKIDQVPVVLIYLLVVLGASATGGRMLGFTLACLAFLLIDYFFQRPYDLLTVNGINDALVLFAFLCTASVTTYLLAKAGAAAQVAQQRTAEVASLAHLGSEALSAGSASEAQNAITRLIRESLKVDECVVEPPDHEGALLSHAEYSGDHRTLRFPLVAHGRPVGTLRIRGEETLALDPAQRRFLDALADYAALAVERVRLVAAAEHAEALRQADQLKDIVLASLSHDLRTPLTTIKALAQASARAGDPNAAIIGEQSDRLARLVDDLLDLSRLKAKAFEITPEINSVEDLIGAAIRQLAGLPALPRIRVTSDPITPPLYGQFDFVQTLRIVTNLLENAARYSDPDQPIEILGRRVGDRVEIVVSDRGPGIPVEERGRVFEPFYRGRQGPSDIKRSGLGLAIARHLAELQSGKVEFAPRPGGGSEFVLTLPACDPTIAEESDRLAPL